jgi:hypothetical protein
VIVGDYNFGAVDILQHVTRNELSANIVAVWIIRLENTQT